ncbi:unnamed protein product [Acanthoscelides obtectus]|uniref:Transposase n=1 Tax=Acanthoscelides obtectus TaxID=200917 RepID=A0A9P0PK39_ACAOB|nr:unnamed protein product [Acanthoscelides obtectus]CAK1633034.1 hypothetical protein AOBTE_LOCUS7890 [Acanthoscelides obtectus]
MELNREHFRAIIYYNFQRQLWQQECLAELLSVFGNEAPHQSIISRWYGEFKRGRVSLSDDPRVGAPKTAVTQENVDAVRKLIIEDRRVTYREIQASLKISKTSIKKKILEELGVRKLVYQQKAARVNWCPKTLDRLNSGNSKNVYSIVRGDESWIYCEEKPTKVIRSRSVSKKMVATFVSKTGHIATVPLNEQRTVTADWYTTICLLKVITELRKINPKRRIILQQDNASSHTAQKTRHRDLSPNDFFTFPKMKNRLHGQRFQSPEEIVNAFKNAVLDLPANDWNTCFENWFERMQIVQRLIQQAKIKAHSTFLHRTDKPMSSPETSIAVRNAKDQHDWCRQRSLWNQEWNSIVFSDESRFSLGMHDGRARVRRRRGERRSPQFFVERHVHHTVGVMVWGAIAYGSRSPLIFIRGNMNAQRYIHEVLEPHLLPYLDILADPTFQQDNARPHVARVTIDFFQHNDVTLLPWPPRSPDLSPIEHVGTLEALREELVVAWNEIPQEDIDHLIRSMPRRVGGCVAHQGASIHY